MSASTTKDDGLFVGGQSTRREDYVRVLGLPHDAGWSDIAGEQSRRYFASRGQLFTQGMKSD